MNESVLADCGTLELWLKRNDPKSDWTLDGARTSFDTYSNRMNPEAPVPIGAAFHPTFAAILSDELAKIVNDEAYDRPEFQLHLPGVVLGGLHILGHVAQDNSATANVRFSQVFGRSARVFREPFDGEATPERQVAKLSVPVLEELLLPALEVFDHILENGISETHAELLRARVKTMRAKRDELSDCISLLTDYLESTHPKAQLASAKVEPSPDGPTTDQRNLGLALGGRLLSEPADSRKH